MLQVSCKSCCKSTKNGERQACQACFLAYFIDRSEANRCWILTYLSYLCQGTGGTGTMTVRVLEICITWSICLLPIGRGSLVSLLKHLLSNGNPHSHFHPVYYQSTECCLSLHTLAMSDANNCGSGGGDDSTFGLRIASVFIILVGSMSGALFPVLAKRSSWLHVPKPVFEFVLKSFI